jgi:hypothetical protein
MVIRAVSKGAAVVISTAGVIWPGSPLSRVLEIKGWN